MKPSLRFPENQIKEIASRYRYSLDEDGLLNIKDQIRRRGYLKKSELKKIALWKAPRIAGRIERNDEKYVHEITAFSLASKSERARIESLTVLDGVSWPMASVILHFYHGRKYPILDFRALWSVGLEAPGWYKFDFWWVYVEFCRKIAKRNRVTMRVFDQALWQYSKENQ
ncbi:hypothetical protein ACFL4G_06435 [Thermodesulfobacteriota bacterium]